MNSYVNRTIFVLLALVAVAVVIVLRLPVVSLVDWEEQGVQVTDLERSTLISGDIYLDFGSMSGLDRMQATWQWCPGWQPLSWCLQLETRDMQFDGDLSLGVTSARIQAADIQLDSLAAAGVDPALATLSGQIRIDDLRIADRSCPARSLETLAARAQIHQIGLLGSSLGAANIVATASQGLMEAVLTGDHLSGRIGSNNSLDYSGNLIVVPPPEFASIFGQFAQPNAEGEYEWKISGQWACGWS